MKKVIFLFVAVAALLMTACNDHETYADQKERERNAINDFIIRHGINVISETTFKAQNNTTDTARNEYVLFEGTGVYMQIVREGCGEVIKKGESATVLCRYTELNILTDSLQTSNNNLYYSAIVDKMSVTNTSGTFTASFDASSSVMFTSYGSTSVPSGWLAPLPYIKIGRPKTADESIARVHLIVPHSEGQTYAMSSVYPCYYEITYERGL